jgi:SagB-type dehydrogenase family enzyme
MRVKSPRTLVAFPKGQDVVVYNYLTHDAIVCPVASTYWLSLASDWTDIEEIVEKHPELEPSSIRTEIQNLVSNGMMVAEGSEAAEADRTYVNTWELGTAAGLFHFTLVDNEYGSLDDSIRELKQRALVDPSPQLFWRNSSTSIPLPQPDCAENRTLLAVMKKRRTARSVRAEPITIGELSQVLFSGVGITGFVQSETAVLPLKMTPSGGARNPYEAFVWARDVEGLEPGIYHYSATEHSLQKVADSPNEAPQQYLQNQDWANPMPAIIFLVAVLERVSWKYHDPNAYRAVMIEAGHISQNMMLACAANGMSMCPTAALCHSKISNLLQLSKITHTPVYALMTGKPEASTDVVYSVEEATSKGLVTSLLVH